jgi:YbbR domain-containing protein
MEIVHASVNAVRVNLSGSGTLVKSTRADQVRVKLDLSTASAGQNDFAVTSANISLPPGLVLKNLTPQTVVVDMDVTVRKELPVQVDWSGRLPENLILVEAAVDPARVEIAGVKRILENLQTIYTEKVPLDRLRDGAGVMEVPLAIQPASLKAASGANEKVAVKYLTRRRE